MAPERPLKGCNRDRGRGTNKKSALRLVFIGSADDSRRRCYVSQELRGTLILTSEQACLQERGKHPCPGTIKSPELSSEDFIFLHGFGACYVSFLETYRSISFERSFLAAEISVLNGSNMSLII
jgi:hypothetical protein